ncbi:hypothetical protein M4951_00795 [Blastopirellula sp. J2-11]|uniref:hypothetical protein n=1 Tax=Blastopirellula sp. J2-11 TaxID=2943192 RepID=UPI0021C5883C|nr:hypothetical protein [Blastopirellula sp. J2-11]UUO06865.1 hypothetical protein M4951_00795 [Blastopirellula sp. J2-11]
MKYFYFDEGKQKGIDGGSPKEATLPEVLTAWEAMSGEPLSFLGIVSEAGVTVQFLWEEDESMVIDIPVPDKSGSWTKSCDAAECQQVIAGFYAGADPTQIDGLTFEEW